MGFLTKKERRVPDLSRYDYHYQNKPAVDSSKYYVPREYGGKRLSASAAAAAIYTNPNPNATGVSRSYSLMHSYNPAAARQPPAGRTYSLRSDRASSITSNSRRPAAGKAQVRRASTQQRRASVDQELGTGVNQPRTNSITVTTTKVRDPQGRTKSITKKTVRRINGYEVVETTTTTTTTEPLPTQNGKMPANMDLVSVEDGTDVEEEHDDGLPSPQAHFDEFSGDFVAEDDLSSEVLQHQQQQYIEDIVEEETEEEEDPGHTGTKRLPGEFNEPPRTNIAARRSNSLTGSLSSLGAKKTISEEVPLDQTSSVSKFSDAMEYIPPTTTTAKPKKSNLRNSMTARKLTQPQQGQNQRRTVSFTQGSIDHMNTTKKKKQPLTEQEMYLQALEVAKKKVYKTDDPAVVGNAANNSNKRVSTMGKRMTLRDSAPVPRSSSMMMNKFHDQGSARNNVAQQQTDVRRSKSMTGSAVPPQAGKKKLTDEEMYEKALEIAQKRYDDLVSADTAAVGAASVGAASAATPVASTAPKKSGFKQRFTKTFHTDDNKSKINNASAGGMVSGGAAAVEVAPGVTTTDPVVAENVNEASQMERMDNVEMASASAANEYAAPAAGFRATSAPLYQSRSAEPVGAYVASDAPISKYKIVDKILKFAQSNYGYQAHDDEEAAMVAPATAPATAPAGTSMAQPVVVPVERRSSVGKHGNTTTLPVETPLADNASESSFRHTHPQEQPVPLSQIEKKISVVSETGSRKAAPAAAAAKTPATAPAMSYGTAKTPFIDIDAVDALSGHVPFEEATRHASVATAATAATGGTTGTAATTGTGTSKKKSFLRKLFGRK